MRRFGTILAASVAASISANAKIASMSRTSPADNQKKNPCIFTPTAFDPIRASGRGEVDDIAGARASFAVDWCLIPHPAKASKGGEDVIVVLPYMLAVADGVGGWAEVGVNPRLYPERLCMEMRDIAIGEKNSLPKPREIMERAGKTIAKDATL